MGNSNNVSWDPHICIYIEEKRIKSKPVGEVEQDLVVGAAPESLALAGAAVDGGKRHCFPS